MRNSFDSSGELQIPQTWLPALRAGWLLLVLVLVGLYLAGLAPFYQQLRVPCREVACALLELTPGEAKALQNLGLSMEFYAGYQVGLDVFVSSFLLFTAGLVIWRRPESVMGILLALTLIAALRDEIDLDSLADAWIRLVDETMQPERVTLWLKETKRGAPV